MLGIKLFACCDIATRDAETNAISIVNVIEEIQASEFPGGLLRLSVIGMLTREETDPEDYELVGLIAMGDVEVGRFAVAVRFGGKLNSRLIAKLHGVPLPNPGTLKVSLKHDDAVMASWSILVSRLGGELVAQVNNG